jgi:hypothetical protein
MQWLNKELNEAQTGSRPHINMPSHVPTFKPTVPPSKASIPPGVTTAPASATDSSAAMHDLPPLGIAPSSSIVASFALPAATKFDVRASVAQGGHGQMKGSLKSLASVASSRSPESTDTAGGFSDYLQGASAVFT